MSFVKDDHSYTRGVGAVAAMDAVSGNRRRAAARGAVAMARRDRVMARHTLGRINQRDEGDGGGGTSPGLPTPPRAPVRPPIVGKPPVITIPPKPLPPRIRDFAVIPTKGILVKDPGSVIPTAPTADGGSVVVVPPKSTVTITPGAATPMPVPPRPTYTPPSMPDFESMPDITIDTSAEPAPAKKSNVLLYAALGVGALWLLTRNRS